MQLHAFFPQKVFSRKCLIKKDVSTSRISSILCKFSTELCTHHNTCYLSENSKYLGHWLGLKETASVQPSVKNKIKKKKWRCCRTARFRLNGVALKFISELQLSSYFYSSLTGPGRFALKFFPYSLRDIYVTKSSSSRIMKVVNTIYSSPVLV